MKILMYTDVHFSQNSSIIRSRGNNYSKRLENCINSVNWAEQLASKEKCDMVVCLGDFFDTSTLCAEEITALKEIRWSNLKHIFLVGNHESNIKTLEYNSINCLKKDDFIIVNKPEQLIIDNINFLFLPYLAKEEINIKDYIDKKFDTSNGIIFSHNDIKGINYGKCVSKNGIALEDIKDNCKLFLNGHLHNGRCLSKEHQIYNIGNLTGKDFSENANEYSHCAYILDTSTFSLQPFENPFAFNFYKFEIDSKKDLPKLKNLKDNSILSIKCIDTLKDEVKELTKDFEKRIILYRNCLSTTELQEIKLNNIDHLKQFSDFIFETLGYDEIVNDEISNILNGGAL